MNIYPAEVEAVLLDHPAVRDAAVIGIPDHEFGETGGGHRRRRRRRDRWLPEPGRTEGLAAELDRHCRRSLAGFKAPRAYSFTDELPREATGKIRKKALAESVPRADRGVGGAPVTDRPDLAHPATYAAGVPHAEFARRREQEPVSWVPEPLLWRHSSGGRIAAQGSGFWAATTYEAVLSASRRPADFSSAAKGVFLTDPRTPGDLRLTRQLLVNMDAPQHGRIRKLVTSVFTPRAVRELTASVAVHAEALAAKVVQAGDFDAVTDLAVELPLLVLSDLLGMPPQDRHQLYRWSNHLVGFDDPEYGGGDVDAYRTTMAEAFSYALKLGMQRREHPTGDLISLLANAEVDGERLSDREFGNFWLLLVVAGNETTRHAIAVRCRRWPSIPTSVRGWCPARYRCRARWRSCCAGSPRSCSSAGPPPATPSCAGNRSPRARRWCCSTSRPTGTPRCSPTRSGSTSAGTPIRTWPSASGRTSASARTWPGWSWYAAVGVAAAPGPAGADRAGGAAGVEFRQRRQGDAGPARLTPASAATVSTNVTFGPSSPLGPGWSVLLATLKPTPALGSALCARASLSVVR